MLASSLSKYLSPFGNDEVPATHWLHLVPSTDGIFEVLEAIPMPFNLQLEMLQLLFELLC
jgi:hypothetical protein